MVKNDFTLAELSAKTGEFSDKVLIIKKKVLMSQGIWNNLYYDKTEIQKAFQNTDWSSRDKSNLFIDHLDKGSREWIGEVKNYQFEGDTLYGDLYVSDLDWASKLKYGKPHVGISPKVKGLVDEEKKVIKNFTYENFSVVINPAVKTAYINNMAEMEVEEKSYQELELSQKPKEALSKITSEEEAYSMDTMADLFELWELKGLKVSQVLQKAEELKGEKEELREAARRAAKILEDEAIKKEEEKKEEGKVEEENKPEPAPAEPEPAPAAPEPAEPVKPTEEAEAKMKEMEKKIKTLSEKLDEPAERTLVKKEVELSEREADEMFMRYLQEINGGLGVDGY